MNPHTKIQLSKAQKVMQAKRSNTLVQIADIMGNRGELNQRDYVNIKQTLHSKRQQNNESMTNSQTSINSPV